MIHFSRYRVFDQIELEYDANGNLCTDVTSFNNIQCPVNQTILISFVSYLVHFNFIFRLLTSFQFHFFRLLSSFFIPWINKSFQLKRKIAFLILSIHLLEALMTDNFGSSSIFKRLLKLPLKMVDLFGVIKGMKIWYGVSYFRQYRVRRNQRNRLQLFTLFEHNFSFVHHRKIVKTSSISYIQQVSVSV